MIEVGDLVLWKNFYTCEVVDKKDGLLKIKPYCNAFVWVRESDVRWLQKGSVRTGKQKYV